MANHAKVTTKKRMSPTAVTCVLRSLSERVFQGLISVSYTKTPGGKHHYGEHLWSLNFVGNGGDVWMPERYCWLNSTRQLEIRHSAGDFSWWLDCVVENEIAVVFDGMISDDGVSERWPGEPNKYDDLHAYLARTTRKCLIPKALLIRLKLDGYPSEFRKNTPRRTVPA